MTTCPGCDGQKSKRAALCKTCRTSANRVGAQVLTELGGRARPTPGYSGGNEPINPAKRDAFHGKCSELDRRDMLPPGSTKRRALEWASERFGREITSASDPTQAEARELLDWLETQLDERRQAESEGAGGQASATPRPARLARA